MDVRQQVPWTGVICRRSRWWPASRRDRFGFAAVALLLVTRLPTAHPGPSRGAFRHEWDVGQHVGCLRRCVAKTATGRRKDATDCTCPDAAATCPFGGRGRGKPPCGPGVDTLVGWASTCSAPGGGAGLVTILVRPSAATERRTPADSPSRTVCHMPRSLSSCCEKPASRNHSCLSPSSKRDFEIP
jgi:hypothetical protein